MMTLEDLAAIRDRMKGTFCTQDDAGAGTRVVVGMATCGIAAGARPVMEAMAEGVAQSNLENVVVEQTGCIGICQFEPVVEVHRAGQERVTYVNMTVEKVGRVVAEHLAGGKPVVEYTVGAAGL